MFKSPMQSGSYRVLPSGGLELESKSNRVPLSRDDIASAWKKIVAARFFERGLVLTSDHAEEEAESLWRDLLTRNGGDIDKVLALDPDDSADAYVREWRAPVRRTVKI